VDGSSPGPATKTQAALQDALLDTLASGAPTPTSDPMPKTAVTSQPADKTSSTTQLSSLMQSLQPATHRETSAPAAQAQTPASQSSANQAAQPAGAQTQGSDSNNSSGGHSHSEQSRNATDGSSPQSTQQAPDSANAAAAPPSAASNSGTIANLAADNTGGISAAVAAQNSGTSSTTLHVAPASQANVQAAPPDLNALAINIAAKSQGGAKQFDISLEPAELGRVEVRLTVDSTGNAQAHLVAERPETLQMLQRDSGTLSHALKESGVQLGDNGLQFSLKGQERQGDGAQQGAPRARPLALSAVTSAQNILSISSSYGLAFSQAGIDIRV
jgi:flagellar hook-length control protein FliK